jgi:hypothetical protein
MTMSILTFMLVSEFAKYLDVRYSTELALVDPTIYPYNKVHEPINLDFHLNKPNHD